MSKVHIYINQKSDTVHLSALAFLFNIFTLGKPVFLSPDKQKETNRPFLQKTKKLSSRIFLLGCGGAKTAGQRITAFLSLYIWHFFLFEAKKTDDNNNKNARA
eukprot:GEMP01105475.1.p2 GENE.GEMP01105475.1~~GEMP01105475.1.p2  ORF type:complete len:103 (-),score=3.75 GEMP01105475.1:53-361(-)